MYYPRTKADGGGPGLKGIKKDSDVAPGYYKINRDMTEKRGSSVKFTNTPNKNFVERYVKAR